MTRFGIVAGLVVAAVLALSVPIAAGLYGGEPVPAERGAAVAYLQWRARGASGSCSGVLIDPRLVLTAGHCVRSPRLGALRIARARIGNPSGTTITRRVTAVHVHPGFDPARPEAGSDLALLVLARPVDDRAPARLATEAEQPSRQGIALEIAGYGITRAQARSAPGRVLRSARLEHLSPFHCFSGPVEEMARTRMCAASPSAGVCPGDSGAPAFVRIGEEDVVAGIVSLAIDRAVCSETATVITRVAPQRAWIDEVRASLAGDGGAHGVEGER